MKISKAYCLFEQSGTFKNEFKKLGIDAEDFDILNQFGETDHVIDLFTEIRGGTKGRQVFLMRWIPNAWCLHSFLALGSNVRYRWDSEARCIKTDC